MGNPIISKPTFDLFIAGGGINGAALARLSALQGVSTALAEAGDFGQGASSNTSKLVHGGLRYLETYDFGLVRDAVLERAQLLKLAPHLVRQARFLFPLCDTARHGRLAAKAGMVLYDALAGSHRIQPHGYVPPAELRKLEPAFLPDESPSAYAYSDCVMDDARLTLETILDAESLGAQIWNYHRITALSPSDEGWEITLENRLTGREKIISARKVALTLGPWTDIVLQRLREDKTRKPLARLSRGSHLLVEGLPASSCFILPVPDSRRYFFVIPYRGYHLVGTTEVELSRDPGWDPLAGKGEKEELMSLVHRYFPTATPGIITTFSGVRPLAAKQGSSTIGLSREHAFRKIEDGLFAAIGGKYTTHRVLARDFFCFIFGKKKSELPIPDRSYPGSFGSDGEEGLRLKLQSIPTAVPMEAAWPRWISTYGSRSVELAEYIGAEAGRERPLGPGLCAGEVSFSAEREHCRTAVDFFRRRTGLYFTPSGGKEYLEEVERILSESNTGRGNPPFDRLRDHGVAPTGVNLLGVDGNYRHFLRQHEHRAAD